MTTNACPHCGIRLTMNERKLPKCPVCKKPLAQAPESVLTPEMQARLEQIQAVASAMGQAPPVLESSPPKPIRRTLRFVGGGFLTLCTLGLLVVTLADLKLWASSLGWPRVSGKITSSEVATLIGTTRRGSRVTTYQPEVTCEYQVGGEQFRTSRLVVGRDWRSGGVTRGTAEGIVATYPVGGSVDVAYRPGDPSNGLIRRQLSVSALTMLFLNVGFTWLGLRLFVPSVVASHRHTPGNLTIFRSQPTEIDVGVLMVTIIGFGITYIASGFIL